MREETHEKHWLAMLRRFEEAGESGINRRYVPRSILYTLEDKGYITQLEPFPTITDAGLALLRAKEQETRG